MKLVFSVLPEDIRYRKKEIKQAVERLAPGASLSFDRDAGRVTLTVADDADIEQISEGFCSAMAELGMIAKRTDEGKLGTLPPIRMSEMKKGKQISMRSFVTSLIAVALVVFMLTFLLSGGLYNALTENTLGTGDQEGEDYAEKIAVIDSIFEQYSLYDTDGRLLLDSMLKAYTIASGDRYAMYYNGEEYQSLMADNAGNAVGIGISIVEDPNSKNVLIVRVVPGTPAEEAGLKGGDLITHIGSGEDRVSVADITYTEASNRLIGEAGSVAEFTVLRDGTELPFAITREAIKTVSVEMKVSATDPSVGIIKIYEFNIETPPQFKAAVEDLKQKGCSKVIFDVRDNLGGDLNSISAVLSYFLQADQTILSTTYKDGTEYVYKVEAVTFDGDYSYYAPCNVTEDEIGMYRSYFDSMIVLTSGSTASAAELFTIVMRDYGLAQIVGDKTKGKGVLQHIVSLEEYGFEGALKLTIAKYNPPISPNYDGVGIQPDIKVSLGENADSIILELLPEADDLQLQAAIAALQAN